MNPLRRRLSRLEALDRLRFPAREPAVDPEAAAHAWAELNRFIQDYAHRKATGAEIPPEQEATLHLLGGIGPVR